MAWRQAEARKRDAPGRSPLPSPGPPAVLGSTDAAWSAPITFNSPIVLAEGEFVLREQFVWNRSSDDPSDADRERESLGVTSVLGYAVDKDFMLFGVLPYAENRLELTTDGERRARSARPVLFNVPSGAVYGTDFGNNRVQLWRPKSER